jgi:hypothetical protein
MKSFKGKNQEVKEIKFDTMNGKAGNTLFDLDYNKNTKRYNLRGDNGFLYSHVSVTACKNKAETQGVVWN